MNDFSLSATSLPLWPHSVMTLHTSWTVQEVIAAEARLLESVHCEVGTYSPADWVHLLAMRFSLKTEQLRQRTPPAMRAPLSVTVVPVEFVRSGALLVAAGFARDCPLAPDITLSCLGCSASDIVQLMDTVRERSLFGSAASERGRLLGKPEERAREQKGDSTSARWDGIED